MQFLAQIENLNLLILISIQVVEKSWKDVIESKVVITLLNNSINY